MKVLMINVVCGTGSTGRICTDLAQVLETRGHEVKIAYGRGTVSEAFRRYAVRIGSNLGVNCHAAQARLLDNMGFGSWADTKRFLRWVEDYDPDVIHLHNLHGYYLHIGLLFDYLKKSGKPVLWTLHDCWTFTGHCAHYSAAGCDKWLRGCHHCPVKKDYPARLLFDRSEKNYAEKKRLFTGLQRMQLVTPSSWLAEEVRKSFLSKYPVTPIPNGIDLKVFCPSQGDFRERYGIGDQKIVLGVASMWEPRKGLAVFCRLAELLGEDYRVVLIGLRPEQLQKLPPAVIGIERTDSVRALAEAYTAADVFVNPSTEETMGMTTVEALACGTPVVTSDKTAVPEVVTAATGIVVSGGPEDYADAIRRISCDPDACIARAAEYEKEKQYLLYCELYDKLLGDRGE